MNYTVGIDSGSTATKGILLADGVIVRRFLCPTPFRPADAIHEAWETLRAGLTETPFLTLTGYGRQLVDFADKQVTEISCHGLGARLLAPDTRTVIDIGGQDSKVIQLDEHGNLSEFLMNDKCAAAAGCAFICAVCREKSSSGLSPAKRKPYFTLPGMITSYWLTFRSRRKGCPCQGVNYRPAALRLRGPTVDRGLPCPGLFVGRAAPRIKRAQRQFCRPGKAPAATRRKAGTAAVL